MARPAGLACLTDPEIAQMTKDKQEAETERLRTLLGEANKTLRNQERQIAKYGKLIIVALEVIKWVEWSGTNYSIGRKPIDDLRKTLEDYK